MLLEGSFVPLIIGIYDNIDTPETAIDSVFISNSSFLPLLNTSSNSSLISSLKSSFISSVTSFN